MCHAQEFDGDWAAAEATRVATKMGWDIGNPLVPATKGITLAQWALSGTQSQQLNRLLAIKILDNCMKTVGLQLSKYSEEKLTALRRCEDKISGP